MIWVICFIGVRSLVGLGRVDTLFRLNPIVHVVNVRSRFSWRGERNIAYKYLKTSLYEMFFFLNCEANDTNGLKRTIFASGGL